MDEENESIAHRPFDSRSTAFQSKEKGTIIKSLRKFGVEIEMLHSTRKAINVLFKTVAKQFGIEHDGSIEGNGYGIEVVSPILRGALGESAVVEVLKQINALKFFINKTCGLHVHLDGEGFGKSKSTFISMVGDVKEEKVLASLSEQNGDYAFIVKPDILRRFNDRMNTDDAIQLISDEYITTGGSSFFFSKELGMSVPEIERSTAILQVGNTRTMVDVYSFVKDISEEEAMKGIEVTQIVPEDTDYLCITYGNGNLRNVLTLLYLHTVYSDVFLAMLPMSRRKDNLYCQALSLGFSASQIENIQSYTELEAAWYKTKTINETRGRKGNNYDDSRYFTMNLHSLFAKYGTIEIRSHSATLDPNKVLYWVAFNQEILDRIVSGDITMELLRHGASLYSTEEKTQFLVENLGLRRSLTKYMTKRIDYFKNNNK